MKIPGFSRSHIRADGPLPPYRTAAGSSEIRRVAASVPQRLDIATDIGFVRCFVTPIDLAAICHPGRGNLTETGN